MAEAGKLKLLHLAQFFYEQTDEHNGVTMPEIIDYLADCGIEAERKALYRDIAALVEFGLDIRQVRGNRRIEYRLFNRRFSMAELLLLTDVVQSSRFLTKRKSETLVRAVKGLGSKHQVIDLNKRIHVTDRIKMQNESVFTNVDMLQTAIRTKRKVSFRYFKYVANKEREYQRDGQGYLETPVQLIFSDGFYYLVAFNDKYDDFATYRVDRMDNLAISEERATRNERIATFDAAEMESRAFAMYSGEPVTVKLAVSPSAMSVIIDRFGKDVATAPGDGDETIVTVPVMESPTFYGWLAQLGTQVKVQAPQKVADAYRDYLLEIAESY